MIRARLHRPGNLFPRVWRNLSAARNRLTQLVSELRTYGFPPKIKCPLLAYNSLFFIVLLPEGSATPDSRHKLRNAGQVFATNRETRNLCGEITLKRTCGTC